MIPKWLLDRMKQTTFGVLFLTAVTSIPAYAHLDSFQLAQLTEVICQDLNAKNQSEIQELTRSRQSPNTDFHERVLKPLMLFSMNETLNEFNFSEPAKLTLWIVQNPLMNKSLSVCKDDSRQNLLIRLIATADQRGKVLAIASFVGIGGLVGNGFGLASKVAPRTTGTVIATLAGFQLYQSYQTTRQALADRDLRRSECERKGLEAGPCLTAALENINQALSQDDEAMAGMIIALDEKRSALLSQKAKLRPQEDVKALDEQIQRISEAIDRLHQAEQTPMH